METDRTANLRTKILDFRGFDSSIFLILRCGIPRPIGNCLEMLSQQILAGRFLAGRLGVSHQDEDACDIAESLAPAPRKTCLRGWRKTVGNLIESVWPPTNISQASIYWYMRDKQKGTVSSNSRFQTGLFQQYSAILSMSLSRQCSKLPQASPKWDCSWIQGISPCVCLWVIFTVMYVFAKVSWP